MKHGFRAVSDALSQWRGDIGGFARQLDKDNVPYLSFSKLSSVESCQQRYLLEYVERVEFEEPGYFLKGRVFHEAASLAYQQLGKGGLDQKPVERLARKHLGDEGTTHILNAVALLAENAPEGHELVAAEEPFVLFLGSDLPPLVGVIDMILRCGDTFVVVDHKGGKNLYEQDGFQLHIYREHVRRAFGPKQIAACFDEYRWVNNLDRIRKPAFQRTVVRPKPWASVLKRVRTGWKAMRKIERTGKAIAGGECMFCPLKDVCPEAIIEWQTSY